MGYNGIKDGDTMTFFEVLRRAAEILAGDNAENLFDYIL